MACRCLLSLCRARRDEIDVLTYMQVQLQLIGNTDGNTMQPLKRLSQTRLQAAADLAEMLDRQPGDTARRIDQRPVQGAAL